MRRKKAAIAIALAAVAAASWCPAKAEAQTAPAMVVVQEDTPEEIREQEINGELEILAQLIQAEGGNQGYQGKRLIASVVLNRVDDPDFPNTITEVIYQKGQFSSLYDGNFSRAGWTVTQEDYRAAHEEYESRTDSRVIYFTAHQYGKFGKPLFRCGDHYFCSK